MTKQIYCAALIAAALLLPAQSPAAGASVTSCAVLPFDSAGDPDAVHNAGLLTQRYVEYLAQHWNITVIPLQHTVRELLNNEFPAGAHSSPERATTAGRLLRVPHVISGRVEARDGAYTLVTSLADVERGKVIRGAQSHYRGSFERFIALVPESNLTTLLGPPKPAGAGAHVQRATNAHATTHHAAPSPASAPRASDKTASASAADIGPSRTWDFSWARMDRKKAGGWSEPESALPWFIHDHLEVGARYVTMSLDSTSGAFIGTITQLEEGQDNIGLLFLNALITPYFGFEFTWDEVEAVTQAYTHPTDSDGTVVMGGPVLAAIVRYPIDVEILGSLKRIAPYAGFGMAFLSADFEAAPWWHFGSSSSTEYDAWVAQGSPASDDPYTRTMTVTDDTGTVFLLGCAFEVWNRISADFYYRTVDADTDATFVRAYASGDSETVTGYFPMSHTSYGVGLKYSF